MNAKHPSKPPTPNIVYEPVRLGTKTASVQNIFDTLIPPFAGTTNDLIPPASSHSRPPSLNLRNINNANHNPAIREIAKTTSWASQGSTADMEVLLSRGYTHEQAAEICRRKAAVADYTSVAINSTMKDMKKATSVPHMAHHRSPTHEVAKVPSFHGGSIISSRPEMMRSLSPKPQASPLGRDRGAFFAEDEQVVEEPHNYGNRSRPMSFRSTHSERELINHVCFHCFEFST